MWKSIETSVAYGTPILFFVLALAVFRLLALRFHRGRITATEAVLSYLLTLLLPVLYFGAVLATGYLARSFSDSGRSAWAGDAGWAFVLTLFPLTFLLGCAIAVLNVLFWSTLFISSRVRNRHGIAPAPPDQREPRAGASVSPDGRTQVR
jgi:small-conductance mechanosensitive channel